MSYCNIHGRYDNYFDRGCPDCQNAELGLRNAVSEAAYAKANPGDYDCPHCKYRSLRAGASRCPLCHGEIGGDYWNGVRTREQAAAERKRVMEEEAAAEWIRTAPERAAAAERAALAGAKAAAEAQQLRRKAASKDSAYTGVFYGATLGGIVMGFAGCVSCLNHPFHAGDFPLTPFNLFTGLLLGAIGGAVIGAVLGFSIGQNKD